MWIVLIKVNALHKKSLLGKFIVPIFKTKCSILTLVYFYYVCFFKIYLTLSKINSNKMSANCQSSQTNPLITKKIIYKILTGGRKKPLFVSYA